MNEFADIKHIVNCPKNIFVSESLLLPDYHLKDSAKEEKDYTILDKETFDYIATRYGCKVML